MDAVVLPQAVRGRAGLPRQGAGQLVPQLPDGAGQRAGGGDGELRALRHAGDAARPGAVVLPHHQIRRRADGARGHRLAGAHQDHAAQLGRARARARRSPSPWTSPASRKKRSGSSPPAPIPFSASPSWCWPRSTRWWRSSPRPSRKPRSKLISRQPRASDRDRAPFHREGKGRRFHRRLCHQPPQRREGAHLDCRLRAASATAPAP